MKQEITATLEALCGIAEATQIDNVAILFNFLMDFLNNCIGLMEVYKNTPETVNLIIEVFVEVAHKQICYLGEVNTSIRGRRGQSVCVCTCMCVNVYTVLFLKKIKCSDFYREKERLYGHIC